MSDSPVPPTGGKSDSLLDVDDVPTRDILEHLAVVEERVRARAELEQLNIANEKLRATLSTNSARSERNATVRFVLLCLIVAMGLGVVLYLQIDSQGSGQLRRELIRQCEIRNANTVALQTQLAAAGQDTDDPMVAADLEAASRTLRTVDCGTLR